MSRAGPAVASLRLAGSGPGCYHGAVADDRSSGHGDTLYEEHEPTVQVNVTLPGAHLVAPAPRPPEHAPAEKPVFVSMKPPSVPGARRTPPVPAIDRPELRPRLRAVTDPPGQAPAAGALGRYAPPRARHSPPASRAVLGIYVLLALGAALLGAGVALWIRTAW